jgi:hypothetical protein
MGRIDWRDEDVKPQKPKGINYSTFKTCSKVTDNSFWSLFFAKCGSGNLPEGFKWLCKERTLVYEYQEEETHYKIPRDKELACQKLIEIFESYGTTSPCEGDNIIKNFRDAKGVNINTLIDNFVHSQRERYKLTPQQVRILGLKILRLKLEGRLDNSTVVMNDGVIESIEPLRYRNKTGQWVID